MGDKLYSLMGPSRNVSFQSYLIIDISLPVKFHRLHAPLQKMSQKHLVSHTAHDNLKIKYTENYINMEHFQVWVLKGFLDREGSMSKLLADFESCS